MAQGFGHFYRRGDHIQIRVDTLRIGPLMTWDVFFGHHGVHYTSQMAFPWVGGPS